MSGSITPLRYQNVGATHRCTFLTLDSLASVGRLFLPVKPLVFTRHFVVNKGFYASVLAPKA